MQYFQIALAAGLAAPFVLAQDLTGIPVCAQVPVINALTTTGCPVTDVACICKASGFIGGLRNSLPAVCSPADFSTTNDFAVKLCQGVGVTIPASTPSAAGMSSTMAAISSVSMVAASVSSVLSSKVSDIAAVSMTNSATMASVSSAVSAAVSSAASSLSSAAASASATRSAASTITPLADLASSVGVTVLTAGMALAGVGVFFAL